MHTISQFIGTINASDRPRARNMNCGALKLQATDICEGERELEKKQIKKKERNADPEGWAAKAEM